MERADLDVSGRISLGLRENERFCLARCRRCGNKLVFVTLHRTEDRLVATVDIRLTEPNYTGEQLPDLVRFAANSAVRKYWRIPVALSKDVGLAGYCLFCGERNRFAAPFAQIPYQEDGKHIQLSLPNCADLARNNIQRSKAKIDFAAETWRHFADRPELDRGPLEEPESLLLFWCCQDYASTPD